MVIQSNIPAMNARRMYGITDAGRKKSTEKLSSGYKINRAADDAAGLAISEKMRRQIRGLNKSAENIQDGISFVQVADGALNEVHDMLHRMSELSVKAANGTLTDTDREYIDREVQSIKTECNRIFTETAFNERKIWEPNEKILIGTAEGTAVKRYFKTSNFDITNANYDVVPYGSLTTHADAENGLSISYKDYNNKTHTTTPISWDDLKNADYSFDIADYFGGTTGPNSDLYDASGKPLFHYTVAFTPNEYATIDDIVDSVNNLGISVSEHVTLSAEFEPSVAGFGTSAGMTYGSAYASRKNSAQGRNFDAADDTFFEPALNANNGTSNLVTFPSPSSVEAAKSDTTGWTFTFNLEGVGSVSARSTGIIYHSYDGDDDDEGRWWNWNYYNNNTSRYKGSINYSADGNMAGLMSTLTGAHGLLSKNPSSGESGMADSGGQITINFSLTSDNSFSYGDTNSNSVGNMSVSFSVNGTDTQASVLEKVKAALNANTVVDLKSTSGGGDGATIFQLYVRDKKIETPIYGGICDIRIQSGPESDHGIHITYDSLSIDMLGIRNTNVKTQEDAQAAIEEFKNAETTINEQRSVFGAYQNRLEHAYSINKISEENTEAADSRIRDTDMAKEMMSFSNANILAQAGTAMMAQANQIQETVLSLLS